MRTSPTAVMFSLQNIKQGCEREHVDWYVEHHLPDVCTVPGARRGMFAEAAVKGAEPPRWSHAAIYPLDRDGGAFLRETMDTARRGGWKLADTLDPATLVVTAGEAISERQRSGATPEPPGMDDTLFYMVLTNPSDAGENEYNQWYTERHLPDVLAVPGFVAAQRFRLIEDSPLPARDWRYLAIYELLADGAEASFAELGARAGTERMPLSPALSTENIFAAPYRVVASRDAAARAGATGLAEA